LGREARVALTIGIIRRRDRRDGTGKVHFARLMAPVKLHDHRMILIEISFRAAQRCMVRWHQCTIQPFVGVKYSRQHPVSVSAVKNRLILDRFSLTRKYLAHVSDPGQIGPLSAGRRVKNERARGNVI